MASVTLLRDEMPAPHLTERWLGLLPFHVVAYSLQVHQLFRLLLPFFQLLRQRFHLRFGNDKVPLQYRDLEAQPVAYRISGFFFRGYTASQQYEGNRSFHG